MTSKTVIKHDGFRYIRESTYTSVHRQMVGRDKYKYHLLYASGVVFFTAPGTYKAEDEMDAIMRISREIMRFTDKSYTLKFCGDDGPLRYMIIWADNIPE
jgi:hypothetical protein